MKKKEYLNNSKLFSGGVDLTKKEKQDSKSLEDQPFIRSPFRFDWEIHKGDLSFIGSPNVKDTIL